jgi:hypothetical protein
MTAILNRRSSAVGFLFAHFQVTAGLRYDEKVVYLIDKISLEVA